MNGLRIAIVGGGPIGLEAALEARRRGHEVALYEAGAVGAHLRRFEWVRLFTPFAMNASERGRARLRETGTRLPADEEILTAGAFVARYLEPLAALPELEGRIHARSRVTSIAREGLAKGDGIVAAGDRARFGRPFLLRVEPEHEAPRLDAADVVLDVTGVYATPRDTGPGGLRALGEEHLGARVDRHLVPLLDGARARFAGRRVLLLGGGYSAATALAEFEALAGDGAAASVTWVHPAPADPGEAPFPLLADDPLPERRALASGANRIAREAAWLVRHPGATVESYETWDGALRVVLAAPGRDLIEVEVDRVLALVGYRPDPSIHRELQVHLCYASEGPMALASAILAGATEGPGGGDCLQETGHGAETLRTPEPGFFILGAKSYGRNPHFLLRLGHAQIEDALALVEADRAAAVPRSDG